MVLKLSKKGIFCNSVLTSARNLSRLKQFTYMHLKGLVTHFQKLVLFIMLWLTVSEVWVFEVEDFLRNFCWVSILFDIFITNISWTVAQTPINHSIFWNSVMRTFRCTYVIGNMETRQMTPIFSSTFSALTACNIHFFIWK